MIGYKVITRIGRRNRSAIVENEKRCQYYLLNKWVYKIKGPFAVFISLGCAKDFVKRFGRPLGYRNRDLRIYSCEYEPSRCSSLWWARHSKRHISSLPYGSLLANAVKLIEEIG